MASLVTHCYLVLGNHQVVDHSVAGGNSVSVGAIWVGLTKLPNATQIAPHQPTYSVFNTIMFTVHTLYALKYALFGVKPEAVLISIGLDWPITKTYDS